jgi:UDP-glucose:(heptosyl)LPS alpha-1,3-glucosyltransferase
MRVAIFIRKWSVRGGNERAAVELASELERRGHVVTIVCQKVDPTAPPAQIERTGGPAFDPTLGMLSFAWAARRRLRRLRARGAIDVAIGFNHTTEQDVYRLGGGTHAELLSLAEKTPRLRAGPIVDRAALLLERARLEPGRYRHLVAPSARVKEELQRHYAIEPDRIEVIWNGVDLARFSPSAARPEERKSLRNVWGVGERETAALFVGQDLFRKGFDLASEAARRIGARLVYVGKADRPRDLDRSIVWSGETREIEKAYRAADVLLAPSRYDPFGGVVLEALASGLPAVASRRIGATERAYGTPLEALFVEDPEDVDALANRLAIAVDPARRAEFEEAASRVTREATLEAWGGEMERVLLRCSRSS